MAHGPRLGVKRLLEESSTVRENAEGTIKWRQISAVKIFITEIDYEYLFLKFSSTLSQGVQDVLDLTIMIACMAARVRILEGFKNL